jgi:hypothetical protein
MPKWALNHKTLYNASGDTQMGHNRSAYDKAKKARNARHKSKSTGRKPKSERIAVRSALADYRKAA